LEDFRNVTREGAQDVRRSLPAQERSQRTQTQRAKRCFLVTSLHQQRSYPLLAAEALLQRRKKGRWIPAFAGMTSQCKKQSHWIPAFTGMTIRGQGLDFSFRWNDELERRAKALNSCLRGLTAKKKRTTPF
jgi:hypothetical protein